MDRLRYKSTFRIPVIAFPWALAVAFILAIGWFRNINLLLLLGYLMAAIPVLNALAARKLLRDLWARRRIAEPLYAGLPCAVSVYIAPARRARLGLRIDDVGPFHKLSWFVDRLERQSRLLRGQVVLKRRGRYSWGPLLASTGYPFGLVFRRKELAPAEEVIVLPRLGRLHRGLFRRRLRSAASQPDRRWRQPRRHPAAQEQFHGLRPFRTGDNPRAVHWRTSARRSQWMVREFEDLPSENLLLVFDPTVYDGTTAFEAAVSLAATIVAEWRGDRGGRLIAVVGGENPVVLDGSVGAAHSRRVLEHLAVVEPYVNYATPAVPMEQLTAAPAASVVVIGAGPSRLSDSLRRTLGGPIAFLDATALGDFDFYEPPVDDAEADPSQGMIISEG